MEDVLRHDEFVGEVHGLEPGLVFVEPVEVDPGAVPIQLFGVQKGVVVLSVLENDEPIDVVGVECEEVGQSLVDRLDIVSNGEHDGHASDLHSVGVVLVPTCPPGDPFIPFLQQPLFVL